MKIVLLTSNCYPATKAGTEIYVHELASVLIERGIEAIVVTQEKFENTHSLNYRVVQISADEDVTSVILHEKPDIVHVHSLHHGGFSMHDVLEIKQNGLKVIATFHLANNSCITNDLWKFRKEKCDGLMDADTCSACYLQKKINSRCTAIGLVRAQQLLLRLYGGKIAHLPGMTLAKVQNHHETFKALMGELDHIICLADWYRDVLELNGVAKEKLSRFPQIQPPARQFEAPGSLSARKIVFIGRLNLEKGILDILDAWQKLKPRDLELHIYGEYADERTKRFLEPKLQRLNGIKYHGAIPHTELMAQLHHFNVLILASRFSEMSPLVIGEAIACGLPIIGSDSPGVEEACRGGLNAIFPRGDVRRLAQILQKYADGKNIFANPCHQPLYESSTGLGELHSNLYRSIAGPDL